MNLGEDVGRGSAPGVLPTFGRLSLNECDALLNGGLLGLNLYQLRNGVPGISDALHTGQVVYDAYDPDEHWQSIREIWEAGGRPPDAVLAYRLREGLGPLEPRKPSINGHADAIGWGDCEDLALGVAAEWTYEGRPAKGSIQRIRRGLAHVVVQDRRTGELADPSITGGMGR